MNLIKGRNVSVVNHQRTDIAQEAFMRMMTKYFMMFYLGKWLFVGTALVAVWLEVKTGIHPGEQTLSLRMIPFLNEFFNTPFMAC